MESEVPVKSFKGNNKFIPPRYFETTGHGEKTFFIFLCDLCSSEHRERVVEIFFANR
jgi:hypothetical protein